MATSGISFSCGTVEGDRGLGEGLDFEPADLSERSSFPIFGLHGKMIYEDCLTAA
jgi:hypothetical protein